MDEDKVITTLGTGNGYRTWIMKSVSLLQKIWEQGCTV
jgi:hypothetical protein